MYFLYEFWCLLRAFLIYIFLIFLLVYWKIARSHRDIDDFSFCSQRSFWGTLPLSLLLMEFWTYWHRTPTCPPTTSASSKTSKRDRTEASPLSSSHPRWCVALFFSSQYDFIVYVGVFLAEVSRQCGSMSFYRRLLSCSPFSRAFSHLWNWMGKLSAWILPKVLESV